MICSVTTYAKSNPWNVLKFIFDEFYGKFKAVINAPSDKKTFRKYL